MREKKTLKHYLKRLREVKTWQLLILLILAGFVSATFLRLNNVGMVERRAAVVSADEQGDDSVTVARLYDLQTYVTSHMNTDMGKGVYLEASYKRAVSAAYSSSSKYGNIYEKAQEVCAPKFSSYSYAYLQCTMAELEKYPSSTLPSLPSSDAYIYNYVSPLWSPDFAGWSVLICIVILIIILGRLTTVGIIKLLLKRKYQFI